jgi:hypothetical protein
MPDVQANSAYSFYDSIGVCFKIRSNEGRYWDFPLVKSRLAELGIKHTRDGGVSTSFETEILDLYDSHGIKTCLVIDSRDMTVANGVAQVKRVRRAVDMIEGCNEHDLFPELNFPSATRTYQTDIFNQFNADPATADVIIGAMSCGRGISAETLLDIRAMCDRGNMHTYEANGGIPGNDLRGWFLAKYRPNCAPEPFPLIVTETGYNNKNFGSGISEKAHGIYIPKLLCEHYTSGIKRCYIYELMDRGNDPATEQYNFGIVRNDGTPKPSFYSLKNLLAITKDTNASFSPGVLKYSMLTNLYQTGLIQIFLQRSDGSFLLIMWRRVSSWTFSTRTDNIPPSLDFKLFFEEPVTVRMSTPTESPAEEILALNDGVAEVPIAGEIRVLRITKGYPPAPVYPRRSRITEKFNPKANKFTYKPPARIR